MAPADAAAALALDAPLAHIRQRLDALVYDNHSQFLHADMLTTSARFHARHAHAATATTLRDRRASAHGVSIQRRRIPGNGRYARFVGVTPYYVVFALFIGLGWFVQALGVFTFPLAFPSTIISDKAVGHIAVTAPRQSFVMLSFFFLAEAVGAVGFGACADHYGRRRVLLAAIALWALGQALVPVATNYALLLACRLVTGIGLGGQSALLITVVLEHSPKRTRGRILVLSQLLGGVGIVVAAIVAKVVTPWRYHFLLLSIIAILIATLYFRQLKESPKYLASIGRLDYALVALQAMESAHGIDRQARVTVPSSLYAPPALQQQQQQQQNRRNRTASRITDVRPVASIVRSYKLDIESSDDNDDDVAPLPLPPPSSSYNNTSDSYANVPASGNVGRPRASTDRHAAASPAMVSFTVSSSKRFRVLFQSHYVRETLLLWTLWFIISSAFGLAVTCSVRHLDKVERASVSTFAAVAAFVLPGLLLCAVLVERMGRKPTLVALLLATSVVLTLVGAAMASEATANATAVVGAISALAFVAAGVFATLCVYTGEHYALMVRAMGVAWAMALGHVGSCVGVYVGLRSWRPERGDVGHRVMLWTAAALCVVALIGVLAFGRETRDADIDVLEPPKPVIAAAGGLGDGRKRDVDDDRDDLMPTASLSAFAIADDDDDDDALHKFHLSHTRRDATNDLATGRSSPRGSFVSESEDDDSSASSASTIEAIGSGGGFFKKQMRAIAAAAAAAVPLRKSATTVGSTTTALRKQSTRSTLQSDGDFDLCDRLDSDAKAATYLRHKHSQFRQSHHRHSTASASAASASTYLANPNPFQLQYQHEKLSIGAGIDGPRRKRTAASDASEPALLDWRPSHPDSDDDDGDGNDAFGPRSDSETDKFSIVDRYSRISTPMLESSPPLSFQR